VFAFEERAPGGGVTLLQERQFGGRRGRGRFVRTGAAVPAKGTHVFFGAGQGDWHGHQF